MRSSWNHATDQVWRQKLYGNVGYRIVEANIQELLADPGERAS
jgi:hypothetical protein